LHVRVQASPEACHKSTRQYTIARRAHEDGCMARGTPQKQERIQDHEAKGDSKGAKCAAKGLARASAAGGRSNDQWWSTT
jgi:hypothetical protein